ncbi:MAG: ABC transporter permease, partial [Fidelibacterota bacterium]
VIIWNKGLLNGWDQQAQRDTIDWEIGGGVYWEQNYDPYDPYTLDSSHTALSPSIVTEISRGRLVPLLFVPAAIYPQGRMQNIILKGIPPEQTILKLPTAYLQTNGHTIPAIIGQRMARDNHLRVGDLVTVRWRDNYGTFDATEIVIVYIFKTNVLTMDQASLWLPLTDLQSMMQLENHATLLVTSPETGYLGAFPGWEFKDYDFLLEEIRNMIAMKSIGGKIFFIILLSLAMLAIFDTQVLSIFRRQKEIGTHIALGMTRRQVVMLFTTEGAIHSVLAALLAALYGIPLLGYQAVVGWTMPAGTDDFGLTIAETIYPVYSLGLILTTTCIVLTTTTFVSYLPARRIVKMKPTDALRGKIQ